MMKVMIAVAMLMGLVGCGPSEEARQHHLYNIGVCTAETNTADIGRDRSTSDGVHHAACPLSTYRVS